MLLSISLFISALLFIAGSIVTGVIFWFFHIYKKRPVYSKIFTLDEIEHFQTIIDNLPEAAFIKDRSSKYIAVNNQFVHFTKFADKESIKGKSDFDYLDEKRANEYFTDDQMILTGKKECVIREDTLEFDAKKHFILAKKVGIKNKKGENIGIICIVNDITEQKLSSSKLIKKNEYLTKETSILRTLIDSIPDIVYIKDKDYRIIDCNKRQVEVTNTNSRKEILNKSDFDYYPKEIAQKYHEADKQVIEKGEKIIGLEEISSDAKGNTLIISTTKVPFYDENGDIAGLVGIGQDITKIKENESKLKEQSQNLQEINILLEERQEEIIQQSEELQQQKERILKEHQQLRTLIDNLPDRIYFKDSQARFISANKELAKVLKAESVNDMIGKTDFDYYPEDMAERFFKDDMEVIKSGKPFINREQIAWDYDGKRINSSTTKIPMFDKDGNILGLVGISRDITYIKEAEQKLKEQAETLQEANVLLEERQEEIQQQSFELSSQNTLLENEKNLLRTLIDNIPDVIFVKDTEGKFITANKALIELTKAGSLENILGKTPFEFFKHEQASNLFEEDQKVFATKRPIINNQDTFEGDDGSNRYFSSTKVPFFDSDNKLIGLVGILRDETEQTEARNELENHAEELKRTNELLAEKQVEIEEQSEFLISKNNQLSEERNLMRTLIDNVPDYIYVKDRNGKFLLANKKVMTVLHIKENSEIIGKTDFDFTEFSETAHNYYKDEQDIMKSGTPLINKEENSVDEHGRKRILSTSKVPYYDINNTIVGLVGIGRDITKQKNSEKQLKEQTDNLQNINELLVERQERIQKQSEVLNEQADSLSKANTQLEQLNATKNKFFSIIAHDLKNPFQAIFGFSELLLRNYNDYEEKQHLELLTMIKSSSEGAYNLLENLLQWARTQTDRIKYNPDYIKISLQIDQNIDLAKANADRKRITILSEKQYDKEVYADKNMINLVIRNLLSNAVKFTDFDGQIIIHTIDQDKEYMAVTITDTGIGMSPENIDKLFRIDKYFSTSGTARESGTGLGLIICKEFVALNKGEITIDSEPGLGTTFTVSLPKTKEVAERVTKK